LCHQQETRGGQKFHSFWDVESRDPRTDPHSMIADCMWYVRVEGSEIWSDVLDLLWQILCVCVYRGDCRHVVMCRILLKIVSLLHCLLATIGNFSNSIENQIARTQKDNCECVLNDENLF
jgi:hypothetical protein